MTESTNETLSLDDARARLHATPPAEFTRVRAELATSLRAQGDAHLARLLLSTKKPERTTWALGRVDDALVRALDVARDAAKEAQSHASGDALRAALERYRDAVTAVVDAAARIMRECGMTTTRASERAIRAAVEGHADDPLEALRR